METILAISAILHGLWLTFPNWALTLSTTDPIAEGGSRIVELAIGILLLAAGVAHLTSIILDSKKYRKLITLWKFMMWIFVTMIAYSASDASSIIWIAYMTIAAVAGAVYLNISLGADRR